MKYFIVIIFLLFATPAYADIGSCIGSCSSEQGICIAGCNGKGECISRCTAAHGRCVARCHQNQSQQKQDYRLAQKIFDYKPENKYKFKTDEWGKVD